MTFTGPDISAYQGAIDLRATRKAGHSFVIIKATEGTRWVNPHLSQQVASARANGLPIGLYHFLDARNGAAQGEHFLAVINGILQDGDLGLWADFEAAPNGNPSHDDLHAFLAVADGGAPRPLGIYSGLWYWTPYGAASCATCGARPLWLSAYTSRTPSAPRPWAAVALWQFTDKDTSTGISLDLSRTDDLAALTGTTTPQGVFMALSDAEQAELLTRVRALDVRTHAALDPLPADGPGHEALGSLGQGELTVRARATDNRTLALINRNPAVIAAGIPDELARQVVDLLSARLAP